MSKLYQTYAALKMQDSSYLYLFKSGIFYIFLDEDARKASNILNLKLTNLNENVVKCGFPIQSLEKYSNLIKLSNYNFKIVDTSKKETLTISDYSVDNNIQSLLLDIQNIDTDTLSIKEAYCFIDNIKQKASTIKGGIGYGKK